MSKNNTVIPDIAKSTKILYQLNKYVLSNKKINPKETILISGTPRSGTTWFEEMMIDFSNYSFLHEPLHPGWYPESIKAGFSARSSYIQKDKENKKMKEYLTKTFQGKTYSLLPAYRIDPKMMMDYFTGDKLIVKSVRMNRLLPWVANNFQLKHIYLIIRHPCAVISSQLKSTFIGYHSSKPPYDPVFPTVENIINDAKKIKEIKPEIIEKIRKIKTKEEIIAVAWCLDTYVPFKSNNRSKWTTIFYEQYVKKPEETINKVLKEIKVELKENQAEDFLKKPSMSVRKEDIKTVTDPNKQLSKWKKNLSEKQIERILKILTYFDLDFYNEKLEPDYNKINI